MIARTERTVSKVRDLMTAPVHTCTTAMTLADATRRMQEVHCTTLVVTDAHGRTAGLLTEHDVTMAVAEGAAHPARLPVADAMSRAVQTCGPEEPVRDVLDRMARTRTRRMPVVTDDGDLHGLLSIDDIVLWGTSSGAVACEDVVHALRAIAVSRLPLA